MSSISRLSSVSDLYQSAYQTAPTKPMQNFAAVGSALQSGDLSAAQTALTAFQQSMPTSSGSSQASATQPFGNNSQANTSYQNLTSALQSGNLSAAQQAFSDLKADLETSSKTGRKGHHHHGGGGPSASTAEEADTTSTSDSTTSSTTSTTATDSDPIDETGTQNDTSLLNELA